MRVEINNPTTLSSIASAVETIMVEKFKLSQGSMKQYKQAFKAIIQSCGGNDAIYKHTIVQNYASKIIKEHKKGLVNHTRFQTIRKSAALFDEYYETGTLEWRQLPPAESEKQLCEFFNDVYVAYIAEASKKLALRTWKDRASLAARLMLFLESMGHKDFTKVTADDIWTYIFSIRDNHKSSMGNVLAGMRSFAHFLKEHEISPTDYTRSLDVSVPKKRRVIPGFTVDEADSIVNAADKDISLGKRDYALLLLAQFTGLRGVDIVNLKRTDINWHTETITIIQRKTRQPLAISIEPAVGNAIADYILNGRPDSDSPYVFLKHCSPFTRLGDTSARNIAKKYLDKAGIPRQPGTHRGLHCFRRSLGARLHDAEISPHMTSQILGQIDPDSIRSYLPTATEKLRLCAISLSDIEVEMEELL